MTTFRTGSIVALCALVFAIMTVGCDDSPGTASAEAGSEEPAMKVQVSGAADPSYQSKFITGADNTLLVWPSGGSGAIEYTGTDVVAVYFHLGRMLRVEHTDGSGTRRYDYFVEPARWTSRPR